MTHPILNSRQTLALHGIFFLSGSATLIFELLWFRLAALSFGSSLWAATAVLAAFMAGLAIGNGLATAYGEKTQHPLRLYAGAELLVAISGLLLVFVLPHIGAWLNQQLGTALSGDTHNWPGQSSRLFVAFILMLVPTSAMGLTLPLLVRGLQHNGRSGLIIGRLYGWNTAGAVCGVLLTEGLLIRHVGITGSAIVASGACLIAAIAGRSLSRPQPASAGIRFSLQWRYALAAAIAGCLMLGLEVVWFRLLLLQLRGTDSSFAYLLAITLMSLALGGLLAGRYLRQHHADRALIARLVLLSAVAVPLSYLALNLPLHHWLRAILMIGPAALLSGALLPVIAATLSEQNSQATASTAWIWLANTTGGAVGAGFTGLYLLPLVGMENSLLILGFSYLGIILCLPPRQGLRRVLLVSLSISIAYALWPKGWIDKQLETASATYRQLDNSTVVATREGLNETLQLLERRKHGQAYSYRLVTDGYSMSGTERDSQRYMKMFAWLPQSLGTQSADALLISYGVGSTAAALLSDTELQRLDIVDLSADILAMSPRIHGSNRDPLADTRVRVFVEDGRQFLLMQQAQYDVITAEPPPPGMKGVVNLYTREYFQLIHARLKSGGMSSYWLPADQLTLSSSQAITAAFCAVFSDCTLWAGSNYNWILLGSKAAEPASPARQQRLWHSPAASELAALGLEKPAMLGASFLADAEQLNSWIQQQKPLSDFWPKRLHEQAASEPDLLAYARWADNEAARQRFATSGWVAENFNATYRASALQWFDIQPILNNELPTNPQQHIALVHHLLTQTDLSTPIYWLLDSDIHEQRLIDGLLDRGYQSSFAYPLGVRALAERRYSMASELFTEALRMHEHRALWPAIYSLCREERMAAARQLARTQSSASPFSCWPAP